MTEGFYDVDEVEGVGETVAPHPTHCGNRFP